MCGHTNLHTPNFGVCRGTRGARVTLSRQGVHSKALKNQKGGCRQSAKLLPSLLKIDLCILSLRFCLVTSVLPSRYLSESHHFNTVNLPANQEELKFMNFPGPGSELKYILFLPAVRDTQLLLCQPKQCSDIQKSESLFLSVSSPTEGLHRLVRILHLCVYFIYLSAYKRIFIYIYIYDTCIS